MTKFDWTDTIVGLATPQGMGARSILRLAGPKTHDIVRSHVQFEHAPEFPWRKRFLSAGMFRLLSLDRTAPCTIYVWPEFHSATGQAMGEIHLPFSGPIVSVVENEIVASGARQARPGEFTLRSFLAGRLDLAEAEGVLGLIDAENIDLLREAIDQRTGGLSRPIAEIRSDLLNLLADIEAGLDFVDEDIEFVTDTDIHDRLAAAQQQLSTLANRLASRAIERRLPVVVLLGDPNAGKSSLFNKLIEDERAIVSSRAGTTRDRVSAEITLRQLAVELVDTAGFEETWGDIADQAVKQRSTALRHADLVLCCHPADQDWRTMDLPTGVVRLNVRTKSDLRSPPRSELKNSLAVSIHDAASVERLKDRMEEELLKLAGSRNNVSSSSRVRQSLTHALESLETSLHVSKASMGHEVLASAIREVLDHLGEIVGAVYTDDLLDRVFSRFCIGK